jgi:N-acetyl sugar amidotransferase
LDTSDPDIVFDAQGVCNHCRRYDNEIKGTELNSAEKAKAVETIVAKIKKEGRGKKYDCVIGVSGGVDSTYLAYVVKDLGLRPLAVHLDNGWDSELAVSNIEKVLNKLDIDLYTHVLDWVEFRELQKAFLLASTPDGEIPTDHAIVATLVNVSIRERIKHIILGGNTQTEFILPRAWSQGHSDWKYIRSVDRIFNKRPLRAFPHMTFFNLYFGHRFIHRIELVSILNFIDYNKRQAMDVLQNKLGWINYGGKHYESVYTRFFQGYILPKKFGYDKRKAHLSNLICSGQLTRNEALEELKKSPYPSKEMEREDKEYVIKKFELTTEQFEAIMTLPKKTIADYPNQRNSLMLRIIYFLVPIRRKLIDLRKKRP